MYYLNANELSKASYQFSISFSTFSTIICLKSRQTVDIGLVSAMYHFQVFVCVHMRRVTVQLVLFDGNIM